MTYKKGSTFALRIAIIAVLSVLLLVRVQNDEQTFGQESFSINTIMGTIINSHLCVDIKTRTQKTIMHPGENRKGMLSMVNEDKFEFDEQLPQTCERNPKIWEGERINVHKNRKGEYVVNFKHLVMTSSLDPANFADEVFIDVERAKVELGL